MRHWSLALVLLLVAACRKGSTETTADAASSSTTPLTPQSHCAEPCGAGESCVTSACLGAADIAMSSRHTCVLLPTGSVQCWGANANGELGDGTHMMRAEPVVVKGIDDAVQLAVRDRQTCVRRRTGVVSCWGAPFPKNGYEDGDPMPVDVNELKDSVDIALASNVFCGLGKKGDITCIQRWPTEKAFPTKLPGEPVVNDAISIAASASALCAARRDGSVVCWNLQEHDDAPPAPPIKRRVALEGMSDIVRLRNSGGPTTCGFKADGRATCWGGGIVTAYGAMRDVTVGGNHDFGTPLGPMSDFAFNGWPRDSDCGVRATSNGEVVCWKTPYLDKLEERDAASAPLPVHAKPAAGFPPSIRARTSAGGLCTLTRTNEVYCSGTTDLGHLGSGRPPEQPSPIAIEGVPAATGIREIVASDYRACSRSSSATSTGQVFCWGGGILPRAIAQGASVDRLLSGRCASIKGELTCFEDDGAPFESRSQLRAFATSCSSSQASRGRICSRTSHATRRARSAVSSGRSPIWTAPGRKMSWFRRLKV